jgi:glycosyltransferase involved in cell wall biosynthesis
MNSAFFAGKLGIQQRVIPSYRVEFLDLLAQSCVGGMSIFAGEVPEWESIPIGGKLQQAGYSHTNNRHFGDIGSPYYTLWQDGFIEWLEDWSPDVLVIEANPRYLSTFRGIGWMHEHGRPVIGWGLGAPEITEGNYLSRLVRKSLRKRLLNQLDALIAYSHKGRQEYIKATEPEKPVYVAVNSVVRRPDKQIPTRKPDFDGRPVVIYVGRLQSRKKLDNLIRACSHLPENLQPEIWIVGDGPAGSELQNLSIDIYPLAEFKGRKVGMELSELFNRADLFVLPGTGGLAVQEAMAHALPVIVAEGDGTQDDYVNQDNGWLIPPDDKQALADTLQIALSDVRRLRRMGEFSFQVVQQKVNIDQMVAVFIEALNESSRSG